MDEVQGTDCGVQGEDVIEDLGGIEKQ